MKKIGVIFIVMAAFVFCSVFFAWAEEPEDMFKDAINKAVHIIKGDTPVPEKRKKIWEELNWVFDFQQISVLSLSREWKKFSESERSEFVKEYSLLLRNNYLKQIQDFREIEVEFFKQKMLESKKTPKCEIKTIITTKTKKVLVEYRLFEKKDEWRVYDVLIEGVSLIRSYRVQFRDALRKKKPAELIKDIQNKNKDEEERNRILFEKLAKANEKKPEVKEEEGAKKMESENKEEAKEEVKKEVKEEDKEEAKEEVKKEVKEEDKEDVKEEVKDAEVKSKAKVEKEAKNIFMIMLWM